MLSIAREHSYPHAIVISILTLVLLSLRSEVLVEHLLPLCNVCWVLLELDVASNLLVLIYCD